MPKLKPRIFQTALKGLDLLKKAYKKGSKEAEFHIGKIYAFDSEYEDRRKEGFDLIKNVAESGNEDGQHHLALMFERGIGTDENIPKAIELYNKAADNGSLFSRHDLGMLYLMGNDTDQNISLAIEHYTKAADKGDIDSQVALGEIYNGIDSQIPEDQRKNYKNIDKALYYYQKAADQNSKNAQVGLAKIFLEKGTKDYNPEKAVLYLEKAFKQESAEAASLLANCYKEGNGVEKNADKAFEIQIESFIDFDNRLVEGIQIDGMISRGTDENSFLDKLKNAVARNHNPSRYALANLYRFDFMTGMALRDSPVYRKEHENFRPPINATYTPTPKNNSEALNLLKSAADSGHSISQVELGIIFEKGEETHKDLNEAFKLYSSAAEKKNKYAIYLIGNLYANPDFERFDPSKAIIYLEKAYKNGLKAKSAILLSKIYLGSKNITQDPKLALKWFKAAHSSFSMSKGFFSKAFDEPSPFYIASEYSKGNGSKVEKNAELGAKWYEVAANLGYSRAFLELGHIYYYGRDNIKKDYNNAFKWFLKSAEISRQDYKPNLGFINSDSELSYAQHKVGICYATGRGVKTNLNLAAQWYEKAVLGGNTVATTNLFALHTSIQPKESNFKPNYKRAIELFERLKNPTDDDYNNLGIAYELASTKNPEKMIAAYEKASMMGNAFAMNNLSICYVEGNGVVKNYAEALAYRYLAQANGMANTKAISALESYLTPASVQAAQKKAEFLHSKIKENKNKTVADSDSNKDDAPSQIKATGSGFVISKTGIIATAHHVVDGATKISAKTSTSSYNCKVLASDKSNDIAILQIEGGDPSFTAVPITSSGTVKLGQSVFTLGFPNIGVQGFDIKMTKGDISSTSGIQDDPRQFQISVPVQSGNSGGPLFDESGNIVGIVVSKLNAALMAKHTGDLPQNVNYAVKSAYLTPLVEQYSDQLPPRNKPVEGEKTEDLVSKVKDACVMILVE